MTNFFARQSATFRNDLNRSFGALVGIAQGLICDGHLNDQEIRFLERWLQENESIALSWPGDVVYARIKAALDDGLITQHERDHLMETLQQLVGGTLDELADSTHVTSLAFDEVESVRFKDSRFCLTGDFVFAPRASCAEAIEKRGGIISASVTKKVRYVVVGGLGSPEWKHGSFGTKLEQAMQLKREGVPLLVVHEDCWAASLSGPTC
jgi:NAD-dependent DNA ligase